MDHDGNNEPLSNKNSKNIEWMDDNDASQCIICDKNFGRIKNRRHHCRNCGRLVCGDCSSRRHVISPGDNPSRVCDDCFDSFSKKKLVKAHAKVRVDREYVLLNTSSKVSDTLIRLYFLDGSFKTLCYDDYTTASQLVAKVCFSVKVALFEVKLDMRDTTQFQLIPAEESIMNIIARWDLTDMQYAKIVIPVYDVSSTMKGNTLPAATALRTSRFMREEGAGPSFSPPASTTNSAASSPKRARGGSGRGPEDGSSSSLAITSRGSFSFKAAPVGISGSTAPPIGSGSAQAHSYSQQSILALADLNLSGLGEEGGAGSLGEEAAQKLSRLAEENARMKTELEELRKKHDILKSIQRNRTSALKGHSHAINREGSGGRDSTKRNSMASLIEKYRDSTSDEDEAEAAEEAAGRGGAARNTFTAGVGVRSTFAAGSGTEALSPKERASLFAGSPVRDASSLGAFPYPQARSPQIPAGPLPTDPNDRFCQLPKEFSALYLSKCKPSAQSRLFFNTVTDIEGFVLAYDMLIQSVIAPHRPTALTNLNHVGSVSPAKGSALAEAEGSGGSGSPSPPPGAHANLVTLEPKYIITMYEIMSAMEGLYEFLFRYGEDWNKGIKDWLFQSLQEYMSLPVEHPEVLRVILYCITRENKLFAAETIQVVQQVIVQSFEDPSERGGGPVKSKQSLAGVLRSVNRMVETLSYVMGDLMPILPHEFNVIKMFADRASIKIREDIASFYVNNRADIGNKDLLTLLSFADRQEHVLRRFGVDTTVVTQLSKDLLQQYCATTKSFMTQWMVRIAEQDETAELMLNPIAAEGACGDTILAEGQATHWPEDLMKCIGEQLSLVHKELEDDARDAVSLLIIRLLHEFVAKKRVFLEVLQRSSESVPHCIERICANINNNRRFVLLLREREQLVCEQLQEEPAIQRYVKEFQALMTVFKEEAVQGVGVLTKVVSLDFKEALRMSLFQSGQWLDGPVVIRSLQATLKDYADDLHVWVASPDDVNKVLAGVVRLIIFSYIEILLTSGVRMSQVILQRFQEDVKVLYEVFKEYVLTLYAGNLEALLSDLKPLNDLVILCNMDSKDMGTIMVPFVKTELYRDFGSASIKVWQVVMTMKGESRDVQEAVYSNIMHGGWNPPPVKPLITINYLDGVAKIGSSKASRKAESAR